MLVDLFESPFEWILEINSKSLYNAPFKCDDGLFRYLYCMVNMDTQWCYVGIHKSWVDIDENYYGSTHNKHYWNSLKLHKFNRVILGYYDSEDSLSMAESSILTKEFIDKYSEAGIFNITTGGRGTWDHCNTPEVRAIRDASDRANHGGILAVNTKKSFDSNRANHGGVLAWNTEEACKKSKETNRKLYGPGFAFNSELARKTKIERYGSITGMLNTEDSQRRAKETITKLYGNPMGQCHTIDARHNRAVTLVLKQVLKTVSQLKENDLELNNKNYRDWCCCSYTSMVNHIWRLGEYYNDLSKRSEWTDEIDNLILNVIQSDQLNNQTSTTIEKQ